MKTAVIARAMTALFALACATAQAQSWMPPPESQRCPSKWGAGDERGSGNHMKPASVLKAVKLIRTGEVIEIGHVLRAGMPLQATRQFDLHTKRTNMNPQRQPAWQQRGADHGGNGPGRHAVRRLCPPDPRRQLLQLLQGERDRGTRNGFTSSASRK